MPLESSESTYPLLTDSQGALYVTLSGSVHVVGQLQGPGASGSLAVGYPIFIAGTDPNNIIRGIRTDTSGRIITAPAGTATTNGFADGHVATSATTQVAVRGTAYVEQTTNAQRSLVSTSANDSSAGTGARSITIVYLDQTGAGPFTETVVLNGTTAVNTVNTNICFIESMTVNTVGSNGSNVGTINLRSTTGGGGTTVWSIAAGDNQTFGAHHYTPVGKTTYITGISCGHNGTTVGSGARFIIKSLPLNVANAVELQVSDEPRLYGQSSTVTRTYGTAINVIGPARSTVYVAPEGTSSVIYRAAFDFYDQ